MDILAVPIFALRIFFGFILALFLPGFALTLAIFPEKDRITTITRIAFSFVLSISSVIITVLFMDMVMGIDSTPENIVIGILVFTVIVASIWKIETYLSRNAINQRIIAYMIEKIQFLRPLINKIHEKILDWLKPLLARKI